MVLKMLLNLYFVCLCMWALRHICKSLFSKWVLGLNSCHKAWWQVPLPPKPSCQSQADAFNACILAYEWSITYLSNSVVGRLDCFQFLTTINMPLGCPYSKSFFIFPDDFLLVSSQNDLGQKERLSIIPGNCPQERCYQFLLPCSCQQGKLSPWLNCRWK